MTKRKFVIITYHQLSPRWINYYHLDELYGSIDVEWWDCSSWFENADTLLDRIEKSYLRVIKSERELQEALYGLPRDTVFRILSKFFKYQWLINYLYENKSEFIRIEVIPPSHMAKTEPQSTISVALSKIKWAIKRYTYNTIQYNTIQCSPTNTNAREYVNNAAFRRSYLISSNKSDVRGKEVFRINSPDYDEYLRLKETTNEKLFSDYPSLHRGNYIVFLDNYFPFHNELFFNEHNWGEDNENRAKQYYKKINNFFDRIEEKYNMPVIVAAHPIANYKDNPFSGRTHICYRTVELVKDSYGVVTSSSVSFSFAVLFKKPLILFTCDEMEGTFMHKRILDISQTLGMHICKLENDIVRLANPNYFKRKRYINNFMCSSRTSKRFNVDLLRDALINILNR